MIGIDWGTTSFRAFRIARDGTIRDRRAGPRGIMNVPDGRFAETLREEIGPWLAAGEDRVVLSGMIGSRQGWKEAPYIPCPAGAAELGAALVDVPFDWGKVKLVPGLSANDESGRRGSDARRGNAGCRRVGRVQRRRDRLPARNALEMGARRGTAASSASPPT